MKRCLWLMSLNSSPIWWEQLLLTMCIQTLQSPLLINFSQKLPLLNKLSHLNSSNSRSTTSNRQIRLWVQRVVQVRMQPHLNWAILLKISSSSNLKYSSNSNSNRKDKLTHNISIDLTNRRRLHHRRKVVKRCSRASFIR